MFHKQFTLNLEAALAFPNVGHKRFNKGEAKKINKIRF